MQYMYKCPQCESTFNVIKHHSEYKRAEYCTDCGTTSDRVFTPPLIPKMQRAEYNPALGTVVKNKHHQKEICKRNNLVEVGTETPTTIHKEMDKTLKKNLSWDN